MLEIRRALQARGAAVRVATHGGPYERLLRAAGVEYDVIGPRMTAARVTRFVRDGVGQGHVGQSMYTDEEIRDYVRAEASWLAEVGATIVVTGFTLTALLSSRLVGRPLVTEHAGSWVPPVFEAGLVPPPTSPFARLLAAVSPRAARWLSNAMLPRLPFYCGGFNRVGRELGVEGVPSVAALMMGDLTLVPEAPEVVGVSRDAMHTWAPAGRGGARAGARLRYTGPLFAQLATPLSERVERFLRTPGPVVYVAITSSGADLVRAVVRRVASLGVRVLVAATVHDLRDLEDDDVLVESVLPSHRVMPRVALAVTAGGQGSVQTAMAGGVPLLGIPLQLEQALNVALLERV